MLSATFLTTVPSKMMMNVQNGSSTINSYTMTTRSHNAEAITMLSSLVEGFEVRDNRPDIPCQQTSRLRASHTNSTSREQLVPSLPYDFQQISDFRVPSDISTLHDTPTTSRQELMSSHHSEVSNDMPTFREQILTSRERLTSNELTSLSGSLSDRERRTPLAYLSPSVNRQVVQHLDVNPMFWENGWEQLAVLLNFGPSDISHMKIRGHGAEKCLEECSGRSIFVEDVIAALRSMDNATALKILLDAYPDTLKSHDDYKRRLKQQLEQQSKLPSIDRRPSPSDKSHFRITLPLTNDENLQLMCHLERRRTDPNCSGMSRDVATRSRDGITRCCNNTPRGSSNSPCSSREDSASSTTPAVERRNGSSLQHAVSAQSNIQRVPFTQGRRQVRVFLTYSCDSSRQMKTVYNLCECLRKNHFSVSHEESESHQLAQDKLGWLDKAFRSVNYILVLITEEYSRDVTSTPADTAFVIDPTDRALNTRYIYKLMQAEYFTNQCVNKRFIPVVMPQHNQSDSGPGTRPRDLVPLFLQTTIIYSWPQHYKDLLFSMIKPDNIIRNFITDRNQRNISVLRS